MRDQRKQRMCEGKREAIYCAAREGEGEQEEGKNVWRRKNKQRKFIVRKASIK